MNFYFLSHFLSSFFVIFLSFFVFFKDRKSELNRSSLFFGLAIFVWLFFSSLAVTSTTKESSLFWYKISCVGIILIPYTFFYFISCLTTIKQELVLFFNWLSAIFFIVLLWTSNLLIEGVYQYPWGYYPKASHAIHPVFLVFFNGLFAIAIIFLFLRIWNKKYIVSELQRMRLKYVFFGSLIGTFGAVDFFANYGINIYPFGFIFMVAFPTIYGYAIIKYRLMDIHVAVTRATIFIFVYTFILGFPLWFGIATQSWLWATLIMSVLASVGPFAYSYLRQQVENVIFKEQQNYQQYLRKVAQRINQIRDLSILWQTIVSEAYKAVQPEFIYLYVFSKDDKAYISKHNDTSGNAPNNIKEIALESPLVKNLIQQKKSILVEDVSVFNLPLETLAIPFFAESSLFGFLLLGPKPKKALYTEADFIAFDIISSQASLAIENCIFWQEEKTRLAREEQIRRQRAMDHFSASLAHEIDNPLFAITGMADMLKEAVNSEFKNFLPEDKLNLLNDRLGRISRDLFRISKMIKAIREFSGQTKGEFTLLNMDEVIETSLEIMAPQFKYEGIVFKKEVTPNLSAKGNKIHLEEIFVNIASNAIHAIKYNQKKEKELTLKIHKNTSKTLLIEFKDNGYGIKKEMLEDIFLDFVTTKATSEGTGMGLGRVRKIVENHGGKIWVESEGEGKGASFFIELPLAV